MIYCNKMVHLILNMKAVFLLLSMLIFIFGQKVSGVFWKTKTVDPVSSSWPGAPPSAAVLPGGICCGVASASSAAAAGAVRVVPPTTRSGWNYQARETTFPPYLLLVPQVVQVDQHGRPQGGQHQPKNSCCLRFKNYLVGLGICVVAVPTGIYLELLSEERPPCGDAEYKLFDVWGHRYCLPQSDLQCPWTFDERMKTVAPSDVVSQTLQQITDCVNRELLPGEEGTNASTYFLGPKVGWYRNRARSFLVSNIPTPWVAGSTSSTSSSGSSDPTQQALQLEHELWEHLRNVLEQEMQKSGNNLGGGPLRPLEQDEVLKKMLSDLLPEGTSPTDSSYVTVVDGDGVCKSFLVVCALDQQEGWGPFTKTMGCEPALSHMNRQDRSSLKEKFGVPQGLELEPRHVIAKCIKDVARGPSTATTAAPVTAWSDLGRRVSSSAGGGDVVMEQDGKNAGEKTAGPGVLVQLGADK
ncbi:unnamed protein product [Amoebophrya sp. A120]|nr:unnamed protein product [Amoebophrya sp. A120]|eukprot:GSA120T00023227001.1